MNYYTNNIRNVKGNTFSHPIIVENLNQDLEGVYFTCRDSGNDDSNILFQKSLNNGITFMYYDEEKDLRYYVVRIAPEDTENLQTGTYFYDETIFVNGDKITLMKGRFIIEQNATRETPIYDDPEAYIKNYLDEINGEVI